MLHVSAGICPFWEGIRDCSQQACGAVVYEQVKDWKDNVLCSTPNVQLPAPIISPTPTPAPTPARGPAEDPLISPSPSDPDDLLVYTENGTAVTITFATAVGTNLMIV